MKSRATTGNDPNQVKIVPKRFEEYTLKTEVQGKTYLITSEELHEPTCSLVTRVVHKGEIVASYETSYKDIFGTPDFREKFGEIVRNEQSHALEKLRLDLVEQRKACRDYVREIDILMKTGRQAEAIEMLREAAAYYPNNPLVFSYQGLFEAIYHKNKSKGIMLCEYAVKILREYMPLIESYFSPVLYLNLGKACLAARKKKQAYEAFSKGLESDPKNECLLEELNKLGKRKSPFLSFLKRSHPVNRYLGKLSHSLKQTN